MRSLALVVAAAVVALPGLAACGKDQKVVDVTVTTRTTAEAPTTPTTSFTTPTTSTVITDTGSVSTPATVPTEGGTPLEFRLPPSSTIGNMESGEVKRLSTASAMVGQLFSAGDPAVAGATRRLVDGGYEDGYLRDQKGTDPTVTTLVRTYVMRMRDEQAALTEVNTAIDEVISSSTAKFTPVKTPGSYARAIKATIANGTTVLFVAWVSGRDLYGIQVFGEQVHEAKVMEVVTQNHLAYG